jgi:hypothetical protein
VGVPILVEVDPGGMNSMVPQWKMVVASLTEGGAAVGGLTECVGCEPSTAERKTDGAEGKWRAAGKKARGRKKIWQAST